MIITHKSPDISARIKQQYADTVAKGFEWNGAVFQIDDKSLLLISRRALAIIKRQQRGESIEPIEWRKMDNGFYQFSPDEFLDFHDQTENYLEQLSREGWALKDQ